MQDLRGLPGGSSLAQLLETWRGVRNRGHLPPSTARQIAAWARAHHQRTGELPNATSGSVVDSNGENWGSLQNLLRLGGSGLPGSSSLSQLLTKPWGHRAPYAVEQKLAQPVPPATRRSVSIPREQLVPVVRAEVGSEVPVSVYNYRIFVPVAQLIFESATAFRQVVIATDEDILTLRSLFIKDFGGVTILKQTPSPLHGAGARDPRQPETTQEQNAHVAFEVLASATHQSDVYFSALRRELQEALGEGVILIQRTEVTLIGSLIRLQPPSPAS
jgi:hypothetical protein